MKINKTAALITAAALTISPLTANAAAQKPVFPQFNKNEVNGTVTVNIPDGAVADIDITFDSPEGKGFSYYTVKDAAKGEYLAISLNGKCKYSSLILLRSISSKSII